MSRGPTLVPEHVLQGTYFICRGRDVFSIVGFISTGAAGLRCDKYIPASLTKALEEAITCHANVCFIASAIMVRKTLRLSCASVVSFGRPRCSEGQSSRIGWNSDQLNKRFGADENVPACGDIPEGHETATQRSLNSLVKSVRLSPRTRIPTLTHSAPLRFETSSFRSADERRLP